MFPISPLPDTALALVDAAFTSSLTGADPAREAGLDQHPACRIVTIFRRQRPDGMQMLRQNHEGVDVKRMPCFGFANNRLQDFRPLHEQRTVPLCQIDGEEIRASLDVCSTITHRSLLLLDRGGYVCWGSFHSPQPTRALPCSA